MLKADINKRLTSVGPGTPMGNLLRCYWQPIAAVEDMRSRSVRRVRVLGENLVLFKDGGGGYGLIAERCPHRGASLAYGIPEPDGLRCPYHGWKFSASGACLEQPAEPEDSTFRERITARAYPVRELGGLLFAYMGLDPVPVLPPFDLYVWPDSIRQVGWTLLPVNWLQIMENSLDPVHLEWLHGYFGDYVFAQKGEPVTSGIAQRHLRIGFDLFEYGVIKRRVVEGRTEDDEEWRVGHPVVFPNILRVGRAGVYGFQIRVPVDDTHTMIWWYSCFRPQGVEIPQQESIPVFEVPYKDADGELILDTVEGQDMMAWVTQGDIFDRTDEHLGTSDKGVIMYRQLLQSEMAKVEDGKDPLGVLREPPADGIVELPQEEHLYYRSAESVRQDVLRGPTMRYSPISEQIADLFALAAEQTADR
ncbi:MAG: Rieske 2Fe-2S domain-containing protein [Streptosporangiales bacterium]|nr:Rieske 2Fe-2S domain-containing protein [Streptosporangiales bacterium]